MPLFWTCKRVVFGILIFIIRDDYIHHCLIRRQLWCILIRTDDYALLYRVYNKTTATTISALYLGGLKKAVDILKTLLFQKKKGGIYINLFR